MAINVTKMKNHPQKSVSTTERVMATTMSVDEYLDELISQVHEDYSTMSIEEARELTLKAVREEYAKSWWRQW